MRRTRIGRALGLAMALSAAAQFFPPDLTAQESPGEIDMGEFLVAAAAGSPLALAPAGDVIVLDANDIERSGASSAAEALEPAAGAFLERYGGSGSLATLSLRGAIPSQVLVILDGQRLNDARQGAPDLSLIPAESIERIEVLRGGASAVYGADALGGVVVITTKRPQARKSTIELSNVSYPTDLAQGRVASLGDGQRLSLEGGLAVGGAAIALSATGERAANAWPFGASSLRENAAFNSASARVGIDLPIAGGLASAKVSGAWQDAGVPGSLSWPSPTSREVDSSLRGNLGWSSDALAGGLLKLTFQGQGAFSRLDYQDPSYPGIYDMGQAGLDLRASAFLTERIELGFGSTVSYEATKSTSFESLPGGQPSRLAIGGYVEPVIDLGRVKLTPALRYDWSADYPAGLSGLFGLVFAATDALEFRLSGGTSYRAPTFNELWWPAESWGGGGNPQLKPERGISGEGGLSWRSGGLSLEAGAFGRYVEDLIMNDAAWTPQNIGRTFTPGADVSIGFEFAKMLRLSANYEFIYPLDISGGRSLNEGTLIERYSLHEAKAGVDLSLGRFEAGLSAHYWSERSGLSLPGALVIDGKASIGLSEALSLDMAAENLLNASYEVNAGYPQPGLRIVTGLKLKF